MRAFVTGLGGFVAGHLVRHLEERGDQVCGLARPGSTPPAGVASVSVDIRDAPAVADAVREARPDAIYHLAGRSRAGVSFELRRETLETNILGAYAVLEAARGLEQPPRVLLVGSADEYGEMPEGYEVLDESAPLRPVSPYGASKAAQEMIGLQYALGEKLPVVLVRAFNHTGPGQESCFVVPEWARAIAEMEHGLRPPLLEVGDARVARDFSDVRDIVRLYRLLVEKGRVGEAYNACSGSVRPLSALLEILRGLAHVSFEVRQRAGARPSDPRAVVGSRARASRELGWEPLIPLEQTLAEVLDYWRARVAP